MEYRILNETEISRDLFRFFVRHQNVTRCWRKIDGEWCIKDIAFIDDWSEEDYAELIDSLKYAASHGGFVMGAFSDGRLKGFVSMEPDFIGSRKEYLDMSNIHVSEDMRKKGVGKNLFQYAVQWAKDRGAKKIYISAHSAVESQAFYSSMGCAEAQEYNPFHVEKEPCDCQLEYVL